ncbi:hypothetical protein BKA62DRAFT_667633 [Auriculariales sp. MPI-PUGE-AT-0066]|nr:hypothetical protein BKA62DRAFT_667633 [Auriculariales sp. MPI-PUGE-AT-0066]
MAAAKAVSSPNPAAFQPPATSTATALSLIAPPNSRKPQSTMSIIQGIVAPAPNTSHSTASPPPPATTTAAPTVLPMPTPQAQTPLSAKERVQRWRQRVDLFHSCLRALQASVTASTDLALREKLREKVSFRRQPPERKVQIDLEISRAQEFATQQAAIYDGLLAELSTDDFWPVPTPAAADAPEGIENTRQLYSALKGQVSALLKEFVALRQHLAEAGAVIPAITDTSSMHIDEPEPVLAPPSIDADKAQIYNDVTRSVIEAVAPEIAQQLQPVQAALESRASVADLEEFGKNTDTSLLQIDTKVDALDRLISESVDSMLELGETVNNVLVPGLRQINDESLPAIQKQLADAMALFETKLDDRLSAMREEVKSSASTHDTQWQQAFEVERQARTELEKKMNQQALQLASLETEAASLRTVGADNQTLRGELQRLATENTGMTKMMMKFTSVIDAMERKLNEQERKNVDQERKQNEQNQAIAALQRENAVLRATSAFSIADHLEEAKNEILEAVRKDLAPVVNASVARIDDHIDNMDKEITSKLVGHMRNVLTLAAQQTKAIESLRTQKGAAAPPS